MTDFAFGPACKEETIVYGAAGPAKDVGQWIAFMRRHGIRRICCLQMLTERLPDLMSDYRLVFGEDNVIEAPIQDFHLCSLDTLTHLILPFLQDSCERKTPVVVHCQGGRGRTGHVLAAWLAYRYDQSPDEAMSTVVKMGREPEEAIDCGHATRGDLLTLLSKCRHVGRAKPTS